MRKIFFLISFLSSTLALASIQERFYFEGRPTTANIKLWNSDGRTREFIFRMDEPLTSDLLPLLNIQNRKLLQIVVNRYPNPTAMDAWQKLANAGADLVLFNVDFPRMSEVERLNKLGLKKIVIVVAKYPTLEQVEILNKITTPVSYTFGSTRYPFDRYLEGPLFAALPQNTPLLFITDYWPADIHVKFFNFISQNIKIRVTNTVPGKAALENLPQIERLTDLAISMDSDVPEDLWAKFPPVPRLQWISQNWVPSKKALVAFANFDRSTEQERTITIDKDEDLTEFERMRLESLGLPVLWIHRAPVF